MRFFGTIFTWIVASAIAYLISATASQTISMNTTAELIESSGGTLPLADRLDGTVQGVIGLWQLGIVIGLGLMIAFFVASLVKAVIPLLSPIAYPVAGAAAMAAILALIPVAIPAYDGLPGTGSALGVALQIAAGVIGGLVFEIFRPR